MTTLIDTLDEVEISAAQYRTAIRLAKRTLPGDMYVRLSYADMLSIVGTDSDNTVRGHLAALAGAGLLTYQRNHSVHVWWKVEPNGDSVIVGRAPRAPGDQVDRPTITESAEPEPPVIVGRAPRAPGDHEEPETQSNYENSDRGTRATRAGRAPRAPDDHPNTTTNIGWLVGSDPIQPTNQGGVGDAETAETEQQQQAFALLTDSEVGLGDSAAAVLAARYSLEAVIEQVFRFLRDRAAGKVRSPAIIVTRFAMGYTPGPVLAGDKATDLYRRHFWREEDDPDSEAALRARYVPAGYEDVIIG